MALKLLDDLAPPIRERMLKFGVQRSFGEGEIIFSEGEVAEFLPTVISGRVKMVRYPEPGKEIIIGTFGPGEMFAIPPAMDGKAFPSTAVAMEDSRVLMLARDRFRGLMAEFPDFSIAVADRMCGILRDRAATIQVLSGTTAEKRIGTVLLSLVRESGNGLPLRITLRRQDIAEMAGLTLECTIRSIRRLARRGAFEIVKGKIVIHDPEALSRESGG